MAMKDHEDLEAAKAHEAEPPWDKATPVDELAARKSVRSDSIELEFSYR